MEPNASFVSVTTSDSDNKDNILCLILRWNCKIVKALPRNKKLFKSYLCFQAAFVFNLDEHFQSGCIFHFTTLINTTKEIGDPAEKLTTPSYWIGSSRVGQKGLKLLPWFGFVLSKTDEDNKLASST